MAFRSRELILLSDRRSRLRERTVTRANTSPRRFRAMSFAKPQAAIGTGRREFLKADSNATICPCVADCLPSLPRFAAHLRGDRRTVGCEVSNAWIRSGFGPATHLNSTISWYPKGGEVGFYWAYHRRNSWRGNKPYFPLSKRSTWSRDLVFADSEDSNRHTFLEFGYYSWLPS